jgi:integrase
MKNFVDCIKNGYENGYNGKRHLVKPFKRLSIFPKTIMEKTLSEFSDKEKKHLTRKGFRWYVYFDYLNPITKEFVQQSPIRLKVNTFKDFNERYRAINRIYEATLEALEQGFSPYDDVVTEDTIVTMEDALKWALEQLRIKNKATTMESYDSAYKHCTAWLEKRNLLKLATVKFPFPIFREYFTKLAKVNIATHNSYLAVMKAIFTVSFKADMLPINYLEKIAKIKSVKTIKRFSVYTQDEVDKIFKVLEKEDPSLGLYIKFVAYNFLRNQEASRLTVGSINLKERRLIVDVKTDGDMPKRIPDEIIEILETWNLDQYSKDDLLFTKDGIPGKWDISEKARRTHMGRKYSLIRKRLGFNATYNIYSFRHTFITLGYRNLRKRLTHEAAIDEVMRYTGHKERKTLDSYIRYHHADIVEDYTNIIE